MTGDEEGWTHQKMVDGLERKVWVDVNGREISVRDLTDDHLSTLVTFLADKKASLEYWQDKLDGHDELECEDPEYARRKIAQYTDWTGWIPVIQEEIDRRRVVG